jgi:DNA-directed RNA polymerase subunit omega|tara:strand:- start:1940 stop:2377 length:438 start_codon:yes stop_codon:yes gene_type:complete
MARITVEDCIDKFPSRFELVLVASQRSRELHSGESPTVERDNDKVTVIALREIEDETIPIEKLKENLIEEYQTVTISDEEDENIELESLINKDPISDSTSQLDKEIKDLTLAEDKDLENKFEKSEDLKYSVNTASSEKDEQESDS